MVFQQLIKVVEPLQSHEMQSRSFCTFSVIPDANCCQLQHYLLSLYCQTGFLCPSGTAALVHRLLALQGSVVGRRGCNDSTLISEQVRCCSSLVGFLLGRAWLRMSSGKPHGLTYKGALEFMWNIRHTPGKNVEVQCLGSAVPARCLCLLCVRAPGNTAAHVTLHLCLLVSHIFCSK